MGHCNCKDLRQFQLHCVDATSLHDHVVSSVEDKGCSFDQVIATNRQRADALTKDAAEAVDMLAATIARKTVGIVNTTPQMTCFRGAKVCTQWLQGKVMMN